MGAGLRVSSAVPAPYTGCGLGGWQVVCCSGMWLVGRVRAWQLLAAPWKCWFDGVLHTMLARGTAWQQDWVVGLHLPCTSAPCDVLNLLLVVKCHKPGRHGVALTHAFCLCCTILGLHVARTEHVRNGAHPNRRNRNKVRWRLFELQPACRSYLLCPGTTAALFSEPDAHLHEPLCLKLLLDMVATLIGAVTR